MKAILIVAAMATVAGPALAQSLKEKHELQERCARRAAEVFAKEWGSGSSNTKMGQLVGSYENHYNFKLNTCLYLEVSNIYERGEAPSRTLRLLDLNENKEYGTYSGNDGDPFLICFVQGKTCRTEQEWRQLIKPFMEE